MAYAQFGEDDIINVFFGTKNPSYLDIGAGTPEQINNTFLFYSRGGHGVLVEPDPVKCKALRSRRPRDIVIQAAVGTKNMGPSTTLYVLTDRYLNTLSKKEVDHMVQSNGWGSQRVEQELVVPVVRINSLMETYFRSGLDLLSIDVEGLDLEILGELDFEKHSPKLVCIETLGGYLTFSQQDAIDFMKSKKYSVYKETPLNSLFCQGGAA